MASVFYSVPETFRGRFRTDTSRRSYPISYPAGPDARSGFAGTNRHAPNPASRHTTAQTAGTPHTPKAKPPVFRQTLHPSDCSPFIHFPAPTPRFPGGIHVPPDSPNAKTPQPSRHCPANQTGSVPFPLQTIGASPSHTRCPDTANVTSRSRKDRPPYRTLLFRHPDSNRLPIGLPARTPPFLPCFIPPAPSSALSIRRQTAGRTDIPPAFPRRPTHGYPSCFPPLLSSPYASFPEKVVPLSVITANLPATIRTTADAPVKHTLRPD